jgi:rfaE bifunctional protein kinase chain/domain
MFLLTPNARETSEGSGLPTRGREEILKAGAAILKKLGCSHLLTTLGAQGMALFRSAKEVWHIPTTAQAVFDVTGAGDTVIATTALGLAAGLDLLDACVLANYAAGVVVGEVGAAVTTRQELRAVLRTVPFPVLERWK